MHFSLLHPHLFQVTQAAIIRNPRGEVLVIQKTDGTWALPEGALAIGETWQESLSRGILHATGIGNLNIKNILGVDNWDEHGETFYVVTFECIVPELELAILHKSKRIYSWVDEERAEKYVYSHPSTKERILKTLKELPTKPSEE